MPGRREDVSGQAVATGISSAILGYASSIAVVITALTRAGATTAQVASGLLALGLTMAVLGAGLSWWTRMPVSVVWSTPGMALLAGVGTVDGGFGATTGAFMLSAALVVLTGLIRPVNRLLLRLPPPLTSAVLAGVLLPFSLEPAEAVAALPLTAGAIALVWAVVLWWKQPWASSAALAALVVVAVVQGSVGIGWSDLVPHLEPVTPRLSWEGVVQIALPLYVVTMAAQNMVGIAVMTTFGYQPPVGKILVATGVGSAAGATFGGPTVNLAAITGALTAGPTAHAEPERRWPSAAASGLTYVVLGVVAPLSAALVTRTDPRLVGTAAGLALVLTFAGAAQAALTPEDTRVPAAVTLLVTASGVTVFGIGAAPWGLLLGLVFLAALSRQQRRSAAGPPPAEPAEDRDAPARP